MYGDKSMKHLSTIILLGMLYACGDTPTRQAPELREMTLATKDQCRYLGLANRRAGGHRQASFNTEAAMKMAFEDVVAMGGNAYYVIDLDTTGYGTKVIMGALDCG